MFRVLGHAKQLCDGLTRRDLLRISTGALAGAGLGAVGGNASAQVQADALEKLPGFGRAKACIVLYLYGAPSQLETFDPKPNAPREIKGDLGGAIATNVPGTFVGTGLPRMAQLMDKVTLVRSVTHQYPVHGVAYAMTGIPRIEIPMELNPRHQDHYPYIGSVVAEAEKRGWDHENSRRTETTIPANLLLPWAFSSRRVGEVARAGPYGGFLGPDADPVALDFRGKATVKALKTLAGKEWNDFEPYRGITPESRFTLDGVSGIDPLLTWDRLNQRRSLLDQIESSRIQLDQALALSPNKLPGMDIGDGMSRQRKIAYDLLRSEKFRAAFRLEEESSRVRELYGMTVFGQAALQARRLVEAGARFVSVFWDEYGLAGTGWDTHWDHYSRMKNELLPGLDQTLSGLLRDLDERGMLDETLVVCTSEHGRTPRITPGQGGGRDHWSRCYSVLLAGGGIARGHVVGRSDSQAGDPRDQPVSPKDILATMYHALGIDHNNLLIDRLNRSFPLVANAQVIPNALA